MKRKIVICCVLSIAAMLTLSCLDSCEKKPHTIFKRDIADNEQTDGNVVFVVPDSEYVSLEYWNSGYTIVLSKMDGQDTVSYTAVSSNIVSDYTKTNFLQLIDSMRTDATARNLKGSLSEKHGDKTDQFCYVQQFKDTKWKYKSTIAVYDKEERKVCYIFHSSIKDDNVTTDIINSLRFK